MYASSSEDERFLVVGRDDCRIEEFVEDKFERKPPSQRRDRNVISPSKIHILPSRRIPLVANGDGRSSQSKNAKKVNNITSGVPTQSHPKRDYSNAAAIITTIPTPPAYAPFKLLAAPMKFAGIVVVAFADGEDVICDAPVPVGPVDMVLLYAA